MKKLLVIGILLMFVSACGSTYTLKKGGWAIKKDEEKGTCLTVHGDSDPEVVVVCILAAEPVKLPKSVIEASCPKCDECPAPAKEKADGAE
jgi:hypothetical protein